MNNATELLSTQTFERAMALLAAVSLTAGIGLAAYDPATTAAERRTLPTDANAGRAPAITAPSHISPASSERRGELDPSLLRIDHGSEHHG